MNQFLQTCKSTINSNLTTYPNIFVVLGNESCDLDSVTSPLTYAYFLYKQYNSSDYTTPVLPILNIPEEEFPLRTESKYFLQKLKIDINNLIFRNYIDLLELFKQNKLKLILVDHHVLPTQDKILEKSVVEIIDHRPIDKNSNWKNINFTIKTVGSCTTLIANKIFKSSNLPVCVDETIAKLLHGTIVLDTINFSVAANRFTELDVQVATKLEKNYKISYSREQIYKELTTARSDVSSLTPLQILHRDMKIIDGVPMPGVPMLVADFLNISGSEESLQEFCKTKNCKVIVLMGLITKNRTVYRDIGVYSIKNCDLKHELIQKLINTKDLNLKEVDTDVSGLVLYSQGNVKMSRKQIVPLLNPVILNNTCGNALTC